MAEQQTVGLPNPIPGPIENEQVPKTFREMMLYKMDRTLAIAGLIGIGIVAMVISNLSTTAVQIVTVVGSGLVGYIGGRTAK